MGGLLLWPQAPPRYTECPVMPCDAVAGVTSDVGETEALGLAGAGGIGVEEDPDMVPGGDEGGRDGRATEPEGLLAGWGRWAQHEPVQGALVGLFHVKVAEAAKAGRQAGHMWPRTSREQSGLSLEQGWATPPCTSSPPLPDTQGSEGRSKKNKKL